MRWHIIRTLLHKEILRNVANRGGIALALLLVVAAMLLSFFGREQSQAGGLIGGVQLCYVDYFQDSPWVEHLRQHVPPEMRDQLPFGRRNACASIPRATLSIPRTPARSRFARPGPERTAGLLT